MSMLIPRIILAEVIVKIEEEIAQAMADTEITEYSVIEAYIEGLERAIEICYGCETV